MAAPSNTVWSAISAGTKYQGRIGIAVSTSSTQETTEVNAQVWYWALTRVSDSTNKFYFNYNKDYPVSSIGSRQINTAKASTRWVTENQVLIGNYKNKYPRRNQDVGGVCSARFTGIEYGGGNSYTSTVRFVVPAKNTYSITYNANGGVNAPKKQLYQYGTDVRLADYPIREGYTCLGWSLDSAAKEPSYLAGQLWSGKNASNYTLYAVWAINTYSVEFNAEANNGTVEGSGSISRTISYNNIIGVLPIATRGNYKFLGWNTRVDGKGTMVTESTRIKGNIILYAIFNLQATSQVKKDNRYIPAITNIKNQNKYSKTIVLVKRNNKYVPTTN